MCNLYYTVISYSNMSVLCLEVKKEIQIIVTVVGKLFQLKLVRSLHKTTNDFFSCGRSGVVRASDPCNGNHSGVAVQ